MYLVKKKQTSGFTLVELLVVISIIALLISIFIPSLNLAKENARSIYCLNNLRQMAIAAHSYCYGNNDYFPLAYFTEKKGNIRYYHSWDFTSYKDWSSVPAKEFITAGILWQGQTIEKIQQCPSYKGNHNWLADPYTGYNYNTSYIGIDETKTPVKSAKTTELKNPSQTAIFGDGQYIGGANKFMRAPFSNPRDASFSDSGRAAGAQGYRHLKKTNAAFSDGHSKSIKEIYTKTDSIGQEQLERYNKANSIKIGFLSDNNNIYDLK